MLIQPLTQSDASQLTLFNGLKDSSVGTSTDVDPRVPLPQEMLQLFEQVTGWAVEFHESRSSYLRRQLPGQQDQTSEGTFSIVDMSADWPAGRPTGHRAKCDQFVELLNGVVAQLQTTEKSLIKTQSQLEAYAPGSVEDEDAKLVDCFVPEFEDHWDEDFEVSQTFNADPFEETSDFVAASDLAEFEPSATVVNPPFDGWQLGGAPGLTDGKYVNWCVDGEERINLLFGQLESTVDGCADGEGILWIDPLTNEYALAGDQRFNFWLCDLCEQNRQVGVSRIEPSSQFRQLGARQMLIASTAENLQALIETSNGQAEFSGDPGLDAKKMKQLMGADEVVLILGRQ